MMSKAQAGFWLAGLAAAAVLTLGGCKPAQNLWAGFADTGGGRYQGVGIYNPGEPWTKMVVQASPDAAAARLVDDQAVIVTVDSRSGEVRACGDLTGYCVGMNPWRRELLQGQKAPVALAHHAVRPNAGADAANTAAADADMAAADANQAIQQGAARHGGER